MKKTLTYLLVAGSLLAGAPGLANAAPTAVPAAIAASFSPEERANLIRLGAASPGLLQQSAGDAVLVVGDEGRGRWHHDGYGYYYGYGLGTLVLTALIVGVIIASQDPYR